MAPLLLLGWGTVGPQLLRAFHAVTRAADPAPVPDEIEPEPETASAPAPSAAPLTDSAPPVIPAPVAPVTVPAHAPPAVKVPEPLLTEARSIATSHHAEHGETITPAQLKTRLGIGLPMAAALHAAL
ncbi:hypothetical protein AB0D27_12065 [Streptomyces sp. NPDC048415]|uniref:hypothetical protein n=1 Tax=Streptomyces sp. NPDC048415 TaxID=3154822 RepID=UPI003415D727